MALEHFNATASPSEARPDARSKVQLYRDFEARPGIDDPASLARLQDLWTSRWRGSPFLETTPLMMPRNEQELGLPYVSSGLFARASLVSHQPKARARERAKASTRARRVESSTKGKEHPPHRITNNRSLRTRDIFLFRRSARPPGAGGRAAQAPTQRSYPFHG